MSVNVLVNREQRGQLGVSERLRRLLREGKRWQENRKDYDRRRNSLHFVMLSEVEASLKLPRVRTQMT